jgi:hypothetical protein
MKNGPLWTWSLPEWNRPKITITLEEVEPLPEKPPRQCVICCETREGWAFDEPHDICAHCKYSGRFIDRTGLEDFRDRREIRSAMTVIKAMEKHRG